MKPDCGIDYYEDMEREGGGWGGGWIQVGAKDQQELLIFTACANHTTLNESSWDYFIRSNSGKKLIKVLLEMMYAEWKNNINNNNRIMIQEANLCNNDMNGISED